MKKSIIVLAALGMCLLAAVPVLATPIAAVSVATGSTGLTGWAMGWTFSTSTKIYVTHLGQFDANGGGLAADNDVGLYSVTADSLITSVTLPAGSPSEVNGSYSAYYVAITPVELAPGDYFVGATDKGNDSFVRNSGKTTAPEITWGTGRAAGGSSGALPSSVTAYGTTGNGYFGATFKYDTVPEPATAVMLLLAATSLLGQRIRRRA